MLAAGALPHIATAPISDLYHAAGATPRDQATLVLVWQATQGMFDALLATGLVIVPMGLIALGAAMLGAPAFGKGIGRTTVTLGVVGLVAATALLVDVSAIGMVGVLALIAFHPVLGWKVHRLSRGSRPAPIAPATPYTRGMRRATMPSGTRPGGVRDGGRAARPGEHEPGSGEAQALDGAASGGVSGGPSTPS